MEQPYVVVGAGLSGLAAAHRLAASGAAVIVLEASGHVGGQVRAIEVPGGAQVDVGAESAHLGAPHVAALVRELGLDASVVGAQPGTSLLLSRKGRLVPLPAGVGPTGPTQVLPVLRSGLLSPLGTLRAGLEPLLARRRPADDMGVGEFISSRFGREVARTFVDPLLGNLHSGDIDHLGVSATAPQLRPVMAGRQSLLVKALRGAPQAPKASGLPAFASWPGGLTTLVDALVATPGVDVRTNARVTELQEQSGRWRVHTTEGAIGAAGVVVAASGAAGDLLREHSPALVAALAEVRLASVATVVLGYPRDLAVRHPVLAQYNGLMLNHRQARTMKAMTNLTRKWATLDDAEHHLVRLSVGRASSDLATGLSDDELIGRCSRELAELIDLDAPVRFSRVVRFERAMPQLGVGHGERIAAARAELADSAPGLAIAGCAVDGLGIAATVRSGQNAAEGLRPR